MAEFPLEEIIAMQQRFSDLYRVTGMLSVTDSYVQVNDRTLAELSAPNTWDIEIVVDKRFSTPYHAHVQIQDTEFVAVLNEKELAEYGLEVPD